MKTDTTDSRQAINGLSTVAHASLAAEERIGKMDPNETLKRIRAVTSQWEDMRGSSPTNVSSRTMEAMLDELLDLFVALDEWKSKGGFSPDDWR